MSNRPTSCPWCENRAYVESNGERWRVWHDCGGKYGVHVTTDWHKSENDALFAWNMRVCEMREDSFRKANRILREENAKLLELIIDVHEALCADKAGIFHGLVLASMEDDMREMGIEVSE